MVIRPRTALLTVFVMLLAACASQPKEIPTRYVSPNGYQNHNCDQLQKEAERVSRRLTQLRGDLKETADGDTVQMGVGLVLFWPVLFLLEGRDGAQAREYGRLRGEIEAIEKVSIQRNCDIKFAPEPPALKRQEEEEKELHA